MHHARSAIDSGGKGKTHKNKCFLVFEPLRRGWGIKAFEPQTKKKNRQMKNGRKKYEPL